ncbi:MULTISPECIES: hypothetical protein [unclassified Streptomyces]|uniref:hypothetical protein n=1 Tax=unclassified Streptomyces TaxID=2593676 RepID=UPI00109E8F06|nr:hypothetical protein [Streptomyces sp. A1136]THA53442.1 hypothetical protein E6R62_18055 [Streptomyces sp. A1136]
MRARTTAAALLGALALVLPTAGTSLAVDHDDDDGRRSLGRLEYLVDDDDDGGDEHRQIRPADNDTCYRLTGTSWENPAISVRNETESLAVLFRDRDCGERAERVLEPGERAHGVQVRSVLFKPVDDDNDGRHEGRHDGRGDGRDDDDFGNGDEDRGRHDARPGLPGAMHHNGAKPAAHHMVKPRMDEPGSQQAREEQAPVDQPRDEQARDEQQMRDEQGRDEQARDEQGRDEQARQDQPRDEQARDEQQMRDEQARQDQARHEEQARQEEARRDEQARQEQQMRDEQRMRDEQARQEEEQGRPDEQGADMFDRIFRSIG